MAGVVPVSSPEGCSPDRISAGAVNRIIIFSGGTASTTWSAGTESRNVNVTTAGVVPDGAP